MIAVRQASGTTTISSANTGPNSYLCLSLMTLFCINPPFGLVAVAFACSSRQAAPMDWDSARIRGKIAMFLSIAGIVITIVGALIFVLIFFTKDHNT